VVSVASTALNIEVGEGVGELEGFMVGSLFIVGFLVGRREGV
jgi:hypothetical protein